MASSFDPQEEIVRASWYNAPETGDWHTIDWLSSQNEFVAVERRRREVQQQSVGYTSEVRNAISGSQGMSSAVVCGLLLGIMGITIEASSRWVTAFRIGICVDYFWLGKELCCIGSDKSCDAYKTWGVFFGSSSVRHVIFVDYIFYTFWSAAFAMTASFFCKMYNAFAMGGGINEVKTIVSGHQKSRYLGGWTLMTKGVATSLTVGSGLAVGKEGPFVHLGACIGYVVSGLFPDFAHNDTKRRELVTAGAAGGLAVAFGAPVGGVLFALEEISSFYNFKTMLQSLVAGVVAVLVVKKVDMFHTGRIVQFSINYQHAWHWFELPMFAVLGAFCGLAGCLFNVVNIRWCRFRKANFKQWRMLEIFVLSIVCATFNFVVPFAKGGMLELLGIMFKDCTADSEYEMCAYDDFSAMMYMILAGTMKLTMCALTLGSLVPAGVLVPSLCAGSMLGRAFGIFFSSIQLTYGDSFLFTECFQQSACVVHGAYAIVGSAALLCGVTRMTICLAVIMFELTGGLEYLVPVIIGVLASKAMSDAIGVESIYELGVEENGLPFLDPKREFHHLSIAAEVYCERTFQVLHSTGWSIRDLNNVLDMCKNNFTGFPIILAKDDQTLLGYIPVRNLKRALLETATRRDRRVNASTLVRFCQQQTRAEALDRYELDFTSYVDSSFLQVEPNSDVAHILTIFKSLGLSKVIVTKYSKFQGIITKKDILSFIRKTEKEHGEH